MNWDIILSILGTGGVLTTLNWVINFRERKQKSVLDKDDIYRLMAEKDNHIILEQHEKNRIILNKLAEMEEVLYVLVRCKHWDDCPARTKLHEYKESCRYQKNRQSDLEQKGFRFPRDQTGRDCGAEDRDGQPP